MGYYENIYNGGKLSVVSILKMKKEQICIWLAWAGQQEEIYIIVSFLLCDKFWVTRCLGYSTLSY